MYYHINIYFACFNKIDSVSDAHCAEEKSSTPYLLEVYVALEFWKLQVPS